MTRRTSRSTSSATGVQGTVRTRVTKRGRRPATLSKHAKLAIPALASHRTPSKPTITVALPPTSPCSIVDSPPSPAPLPIPTSTLASAEQSKEEAQPSVTDRLSLAYRPNGPLIGREAEVKTLRDALTRLTSRDEASGSLYVCGLPGTGKTLVVSRIIDEIATSYSPTSPEDSAAVHKVWVNCANLSRPKELFSHIASELHLDLPHGPSSALEVVRAFCQTSGPKVAVVLDELDFLTSRDQSVLYAAFELSKTADSRIVLVGIANALDLPTRLLPWLRAGGCLPHVVSFTPYSAESLSEIVRQRLLDSTLLSKSAVLLAAKKVASGSGDARLVLDVVREAASQSVAGGALAGIAAVSRLAATRGGTSAAAATIRGLPVVQQLALCAAANAATASTGKKRATLGGLHAGFTRLCARARVGPLPFADFADVCCNALAHHSLLDVPATGPRRGAKTQRGRQVRLRVAVEDVKAGIADKGFLPFLVHEGR